MNLSRLFMNVVVAVSSLVLVACAQSPQKIVLAPTFAEAPETLASGQPVHVRVSDGRSETVLGSRGGAYRDTALISLQNSLSLAVQPVLKARLKEMGFAVDSLSPDTADLHVVFESLVYNHPLQDGVGYDMDMLAVVRVEATRSDKRYEGRYRVKRKEKFFNAPSEPHNTELVNKLVVEVLDSMLADLNLQRFLLAR